jgi:hypothetical protein
MTTFAIPARHQWSAMLGRFRRRLGLLTEAEARLAYLEDAQHPVDLEMRLRELDRREATAHSHHSVATARW